MEGSGEGGLSSESSGGHCFCRDQSAATTSVATEIQAWQPCHHLSRSGTLSLHVCLQSSPRRTEAIAMEAHPNTPTTPDPGRKGHPPANS
ncbi:hypothetical protein SESBI_43878 [Sesbania bispinosa]|nr:hypothetical protein SESBI_43878 [Sesbania bispinosa]